MQNYKLIKDYPGAPELGYITQFDNDDEDWGAPNLIIVPDCENYPEFWEPTEDKIVYTTESGSMYSFKHILDLAKGNKEYAYLLLSRATWEHIETLIVEDLTYGEVAEVDGTYILTGGDNE